MKFDEWKKSRTYGLTEPIWEVTRDAYLEALKHAASVMCCGCGQGYSTFLGRDKLACYRHNDETQSRCYASSIHKEIAAMTE